MAANTLQNVVLIGCGNVAWHLAIKFHQLKNYSVTVYNHRANPSLNEFKKLGSTIRISLRAIQKDADYYFICVPDKHIMNVADKIKVTNPHAIVIHTSGSASINDLVHTGKRTGVFYPLQTFSKNDDINWKDVPVFIESDNKDVLKVLKSLAELFSDKVVVTNYESRQKMHLAAVLVNNFTNSLVISAASLVKGNISILLPLIRQTVKKLSYMSPQHAQTGPAKRGDKVVIKKHIKMLNEEKELKKIYKLMSKLIAKQQSN